MTFTLALFGCVLLMLALYRQLEARVRSVIRWLRHTNDRVSSLEIKDYGQDERLDAHDKTLETHNERFRRVSVDVKELGRDIGWGDDDRRTDVIKVKPPKDDGST